MYAVGRLGSYITQGVYTVSGPFHPFGGAVDIIVVEQPDGTFKSSPWYVRFGKFQGVLKSKEKIVDISVDGVQSDFHMYLDGRGQAYFLREVESEEGDSLFTTLSSGEDADVAVSKRRPLKSKSCNYDSPPTDSIEVGKDKMMIRTGSRRSRVLGFVLGRKSLKENSFCEEEDKSGVVRTDSLKHAEIAADLLEVEWSTNLAFSKYKKDKGSKLFDSGILVTETDKDSEIMINDEMVEVIGIDSNEMDTRSRLHFQKLGNSDEGFGMEISSLDNGLEQKSCVLVSSTSRSSEIDELVLSNINDNKNVKILSSGTTNPVLDSINLAGTCEDVSGVEVLSEVKSIHESSLLVAKEPLCSLEIAVNNVNELVNGPPHNEASSNLLSNGIVMESCIGETKVDPEIVSENISHLRNSPTQQTVSILPFGEVTEKEILLFGEFDDLNYDNDVSPKSISLNHVIEDNSPSSKIGSDEKDVGEKRGVVSSNINIPTRHKFETIERMSESLPIMRPSTSDVLLHELEHPLAHSLDSNLEVSMKIALERGLSTCIEAGAEKDDELAQHNVKEEEPNNVEKSIAVGEQSKQVDLSNGRWRVWPFSFKKSKSMNCAEHIQTTESLDAEMNSDNTVHIEEENDDIKPKAKNTKKVKVLTPTPEQLASLKLKEGVNTVTFTFSTSMLGPQQVGARIFLWKWDTRIVISDVDGTITKSDVLGQFMPMMGMDWSHTGVAHLYSAIKENGYQLLFLSARAISQAYLTRQFLFNLKQDGKALPNGPVVISPDGLFPSLFREVIRRAPHEFKIACLEEIKALFPSDRSPFYAGFGNRDTDEISYLRVGIPIGKIFIINPKGEVVVNRRVDRKSYTSLKALVHDMFPPKSSSEQEDYNSWNFWKLPPPLMDM